MLLQALPSEHLVSNLVLVALATWRVTHMLVDEDGPWQVFVHMRKLMGWLYDPDGNVVWADPTNPFSCVWCLSMYVGVAMFVLPWWVNAVFAFSAAAIVLEVGIERVRR